MIFRLAAYPILKFYLNYVISRRVHSRILPPISHYEFYSPRAHGCFQNSKTSLVFAVPYIMRHHFSFPRRDMPWCYMLKSVYVSIYWPLDLYCYLCLASVCLLVFPLACHSTHPPTRALARSGNRYACVPTRLCMRPFASPLSKCGMLHVLPSIWNVGLSHIVRPKQSDLQN